MAIATMGGHVARALDFYNSKGKYFIVGGTTPWDDPTNPDALVGGEYKLNGVIGLQKVANSYMVIPTDENTEGIISYRDQNWKRVEPTISTNIVSAISTGDTKIPVQSVEGFKTGDKVRVDNTYEGKIIGFDGSTLLLDTAATSSIPKDRPVIGGAVVEGAKYVYLDCYLDYNRFPIDTYRQIGVCSGVTTKDASDNIVIATKEVLKGSRHNGGVDEYYSFGTLEVLDNRVAVQRDENQRELLSIIIEF